MKNGLNLLTHISADCHDDRDERQRKTPDENVTIRLRDDRPALHNRPLVEPVKNISFDTSADTFLRSFEHTEIMFSGAENTVLSDIICLSACHFECLEARNSQSGAAEQSK